MTMSLLRRSRKTFSVLVDPLDIKYLLLFYMEKGDGQIVHMLKRRANSRKKQIELTFPVGEEQNVERILQS